MKEFNRDLVGRANEGHMSISGRAIDRDSGIQHSLAESVDVLDFVSEVTEVATAVIGFGIPVMCELNLRDFVTGRGEKHQGESAGFDVEAVEDFEAE